ncbi:hypothetical protein D9758_018503 [Tetrapyrgos nigripes]|uniref:DNA 3'-5' helicase n=1 Tax=Tetrapyrgos nigripes TaxID=182062 RepID=A0A8H5C4Q8_9AGAR|nr:hypothetical protein D9758_018503 [Tetrapyrgos nigripes]
MLWYWKRQDCHCCCPSLSREKQGYGDNISITINSTAERTGENLCAVAINSSQQAFSAETIKRIVAGEYQIVIVSPEMLLSKRFIDEILRKPEFTHRVISTVVDEAHVVSHWGSGFRKKYGELGLVRAFLPKNTPIVALSVTFPRRVCRDVMKKLHIHHQDFIDLDFVVPQNAQCTTKIPKTFIYWDNIMGGIDMEDHIVDLLPCTISREAVRVYNATYSTAYRETVLSQFRAGEVRILICTDAAGMGCNIPDIDIVVQWKLPGLVSAFVQRASRAARDPTRTGLAVLLVEKTAYSINLEKEVQDVNRKANQKRNQYSLPRNRPNNELRPRSMQKLTDRFEEHTTPLLMALFYGESPGSTLIRIMRAYMCFFKLESVEESLIVVPSHPINPISSTSRSFSWFAHQHGFAVEIKPFVSMNAISSSDVPPTNAGVMPGASPSSTNTRDSVSHGPTTTSAGPLSTSTTSPAAPPSTNVTPGGTIRRTVTVPQATLADCNAIVDRYHKRHISKINAVTDIQEKLRALPGMSEQAQKDGLAAFLEMLDNVDKVEDGANVRGVKRARDADESQPSNSDPFDQPSPSKKAGTDDDAEYPWSSGNPLTAVAMDSLSPNCRQTLRLIAKNLEDPKKALRSLQSSPLCPDLPESELKAILLGKPVNLDVVFTSMYSNTYTEDHTESLTDDIQIKFRNQTPAKVITDSNEWGVAWYKVIIAYSRTFPHLKSDVRAYGEYFIVNLPLSKSLSIRGYSILTRQFEPESLTPKLFVSLISTNSLTSENLTSATPALVLKSQPFPARLPGLHQSSQRFLATTGTWDFALVCLVAVLACISAMLFFISFH